MYSPIGMGQKELSFLAYISIPLTRVLVNIDRGIVMAFLSATDTSAAQKDIGFLIFLF